MAPEANKTAEQLLSIVRQHFDAAYYLEANSDVAQAGVDPLGHYLLSGLAENRAPSARTSGSEVQAEVASRLGAIPSASDLEDAYRAHRDAASARARLKAFARRSISMLARGDSTILSRLRRRLMLRSREAKLNAIDSRQKTLLDMLNLPAFNALSKEPGRFTDKDDALAYLETEGFKNLQPLDFHLIPEPDFYRDLYPDAAMLDDVTIYRDWLENGLARGRFISETHMLRYFGVQATKVLNIFPATDYVSAYSDIPATWSGAQLLHHFLKSGLPEGRLDIPISDDLYAVIEDALMHINRHDPLRALNVSEKILLLGHDSVRLRLLVIDHYKNLNRFFGTNALLDDQSSDVPIEQFWLEYHRADVCKRLEFYDESRDHLNKAAHLESDSIWVEAELEKLLLTSFERERHKAKRYADTGRGDDGRAVLDSIIPDTYEALKPYGWIVSEHGGSKPVPPLDRRPLRVGFLADLFLPQCKLYRVDQKLEQMKAAGLDVELFDFRKDSRAAFEQAGLFDVWMIYRAPAFFDVLKVIRAANDLGRPTIYEIDDLLIDPKHFPEPLSAYDKSLSKEEYAGLQLATSYNGGVARLCKYGLASTPSLAQELARYVQTGHVITHRNALSQPHFEAMAVAARQPARRTAHETVRIFYGSGTKAHKDFLQDTFFAAMEDVMEARTNVEFMALGHVDAPALKQRFGGRFLQEPPEWDIGKYWAKLAAADINVAVLKKSLLTDCKSEIKWLEAAMLGIPSVVSATSTMEEVIEDGETGLLAKSREDWTRQLLALVDDADTRLRIGKQARQIALRDYDVPIMAKTLKSELLRLVSSNSELLAKGGL